MKLWKIERKGQIGYDEYDSAVVAAETDLHAQCTFPSGPNISFVDGQWRYPDGSPCHYHGWTDPSAIAVTLIGDATPDTPAGVIVASFNAG